MQIEWHDITGVVGVATIILSYLFLQLGKIKSSNLWFSILNALGAVCIIVSLLFDFNLSAFIIEIFWVLISIYGVRKYFRDRAAKKSDINL